MNYDIHAVARSFAATRAAHKADVDLGWCVTELRAEIAALRKEGALNADIVRELRETQQLYRQVAQAWGAKTGLAPKLPADPIAPERYRSLL